MKHTLRPAALCLLLPLATLAADEPMAPFTVNRGDTLTGLSRDVFVEPAAWREVARLNRLRNPNVILPGQVLQVPARLLRARPVEATLVGVQGEVQLGGAPATAGAKVAPGQSIATAGDASAVLELADGSRLRVQPATQTQLGQSALLGGRGETDGLFAGSMRLVRGTLEVLAAKLLRAKPLEVTSPTAVIGVRGTEYRVHHDDGAGTRTEVLEGVVNAAAASANTDVAAGFGALVAGRSAPQVAALLPAPDLAGLPATFERPIVRFVVPGESAALRVQVALDAAFERIVRDERFAAGSELRIPGLDDGAWFVRVRRIDALGIEGRDSQRGFELAARPEPPALSAPRAGGRSSVGNVAFEWAQSVDAVRYALQVARDPAFSDIVFDSAAVTGSGTAVSLAEPGTYHWRVASIRAEQGTRRTRGPWSDPQQFTLRELPEPASGGMSSDGKQIELRWSGRTQDKHLVELARDAGFTDIVAHAELAAPEWQLPKPAQPGTYYFRYRSVEPDGFTTAFSSTLKIEVARDWRGLWLLGVPLLFGL
jgi:hypothetical protein